MKAIHTYLSTPKQLENKTIEDYPLLLAVWYLSAYYWKKHGGKIDLYTDKPCLLILKKYGFEPLYNRVNTNILQTQPPYNPHHYKSLNKVWAYGNNTEEDVCFLDTDLIFLEKQTLTNMDFANNDVVAMYKYDSDIQQYDPVKDMRYFNHHNYDLNSKALNASFIYIKDKELRKKYCDEVFEYVMNTSEINWLDFGLNNKLQSDFAEEKILSYVSQSKKVDTFIKGIFTIQNGKVGFYDDGKQATNVEQIQQVTIHKHGSEDPLDHYMFQKRILQLLKKAQANALLIQTLESSIPTQKEHIQHQAIQYHNKRIDQKTKQQFNYFEFDSQKFSLSANAQLNWGELAVLDQKGWFGKSQQISTYDDSVYELTRKRLDEFLQAYAKKKIEILKANRTEKEEIKNHIINDEH